MISYYVQAGFMGYHLTGLVSTILFFLSLIGMWVQIQTVWERKKMLSHAEISNEKPTAVLSLNFFSMAFLSFYLMFVYGFSLARFNHYLVWSRLIAVLLGLTMLYEIMIDRNEKRSTATFWMCVAATIGALLLLMLNRGIAVQGGIVIQWLLVFIAVIMSQGNIHQILLIRRTGSTGAVSLKAQQLVLLKDLGVIAFGIAMGLGPGWPLILVSGSNGVFRLIVMWHFRWVRSSNTKERHESAKLMRT